MLPTVIQKPIFSLFKLVFILVLMTSSVLAENAQTHDASPDIFVNHTVPQTDFSLSELRAIFAMRKTLWSDHSRIRVFVLEDNAAQHRLFTKNRLGMFPHQLRRIWDKLTFSGTGNAPVKVDNMTEMQEKLANTPGAIGYLSMKPAHSDIRMIHHE